MLRPDPPVAMQHAAELDALLELYTARKPRRVLEIGTYEGGTLYHWLKGRPKIVVSVDDFSMGGDNRSLYPGWTPARTRLEVVAGSSRDPETFEAVAPLAPFDWAFIDADHSYPAVRADWELYLPLCEGVIAFHDILPPSADHPEIQVSALWAEIKDAGYRTVELIDDPGAPWGGIGVVFLDEGPAIATENANANLDERISA